MRLLFKQRFFSWFDSYDIYDERGNVYFKVEGKMSWGHKFHIYNRNSEFVGMLIQQVFTFLPKLDIYDANENRIGTITKEFTFFGDKLIVDMNDWKIYGDWFGWDYQIIHHNKVIATITKQLFNFTDTYIIDVDEANALNALLVVLAIDAIKCSSKKKHRK